MQKSSLERIHHSRLIELEPGHRVRDIADACRSAALVRSRLRYASSCRLPNGWVCRISSCSRSKTRSFAALR